MLTPARGAVTLAVVISAAGSAYLYTHDPHEPGHFPPCVLLTVTGYYCPACGGTRAAYDLMHGRFVESLHENPVVVLGLLAALVFGVRYWLRRRQRAAGKAGQGAGRMRPLVPIALGVAFLAFGLLRNLPSLSMLRPI